MTQRDAGRFVVLVTDKIDPAGLAPLAAHPGFELLEKHTPELFEPLLPRAQAWLVRSETKVTAERIAKAPRLRLIGRAGVGVDNIDLAAASRRGIAVVNAPQANTISACEHAWALLLSLARRVPQADREVQAGRWERSKLTGVELMEKTIGLVGLGRIGREMARRAAAFGMRTAAYDPYISAEQARGFGAALMGLEELLAASDFVSLHVPSSEKTRGMIDRKTLALLKPGARLVNCARGDLIVEADLAEALRSGKLAGAALDVFETEPLPKESPLRSAPNLILTPHLGASTHEAQRKVAEDLAGGVIEFAEKGLARNAINLPGFDPDTLSALGPTLALADVLGRFLGQTLDAGLKAVHCRFEGDFQPAQRHPLSVAALKGLLSVILEQTLSFVNAPILAGERGIETSDSASSSAPEGYSRLLSGTAVTDRGERSLWGTVGANGLPRIVRLDGLSVDVDPRGRMLLIANQDRPGVIGRVGTFLGERGVNIADMRVGRKAAHGEAVMIIHVDDAVPEAVRAELSKLSGITSVRSVEL